MDNENGKILNKKFWKSFAFGLVIGFVVAYVLTNYVF